MGKEEKAEAALEVIEERFKGETRVNPQADGPMTVAAFSDYWIIQRKALVPTWKSDESRMKNYILPTIGDMKLSDVRPHHLADLFRKLRIAKELAPKTIHNAYGALRSLYRNARIEGLVSDTPFSLTKHQLGPKNDEDPEWRKTDIYTREELIGLISDHRIDFDRRVFWSLSSSRSGKC